MSNQEQLTLAHLEKIKSSASSIVSQWENPIDTATRHFVIDELLNPDICQSIYSAFPRYGDGFLVMHHLEKRKKHQPT
jgi:hypothetical protein